MVEGTGRHQDIYYPAYKAQVSEYCRYQVETEYSDQAPVQPPDNHQDKSYQVECFHFSSLKKEIDSTAEIARVWFLDSWLKFRIFLKHKASYLCELFFFPFFL